MNGFMLWFDIIVLALVLVLGLKGFFNGLVKEVAGLFGIVGGIFIATRTAAMMADFINNMIPNIQNQSLVYVCGFVVVLIIIWAASLLLGNIVSKMLKLSSLGMLDRIGGFIFGACKIFFIIAVILSCISSINFIKNYLKPLEQNSIVYEILDKTGGAIVRTDLFLKASSQAKQSFDNVANEEQQ